MSSNNIYTVPYLGVPNIDTNKGFRITDALGNEHVFDTWEQAEKWYENNMPGVMIKWDNRVPGIHNIIPRMATEEWQHPPQLDNVEVINNLNLYDLILLGKAPAIESSSNIIYNDATLNFVQTPIKYKSQVYTPVFNTQYSKNDPIVLNIYRGYYKGKSFDPTPRNTQMALNQYDLDKTINEVNYWQLQGDAARSNGLRLAAIGAVPAAAMTAPAWGPWVLNNVVFPYTTGKLWEMGERALTGTTLADEISKSLQLNYGWSPFWADTVGSFTNPGYMMNPRGRYTSMLIDKAFSLPVRKTISNLFNASKRPLFTTNNLNVSYNLSNDSFLNLMSLNTNPELLASILNDTAETFYNNTIRPRLMATSKLFRKVNPDSLWRTDAFPNLKIKLDIPKDPKTGLPLPHALGTHNIDTGENIVRPDVALLYEGSSAAIHEAVSHGTDDFIPWRQQNIYREMLDNLESSGYKFKNEDSGLHAELRATKNELLYDFTKNNIDVNKLSNKNLIKRLEQVNDYGSDYAAAYRQADPFHKSKFIKNLKHAIANLPLISYPILHTPMGDIELSAKEIIKLE